MKETILFGQKKTVTFDNENVSGINFKYVTTDTALNAVFDKAENGDGHAALDYSVFEKNRLNIAVYQGDNKAHVIFNGTFKEFLDYHFASDRLRLERLTAYGYRENENNAQQISYAFKFDFGTVYNLGRGKRIKVEFEFDALANVTKPNSTLDNTNAYVEVDSIEGIGLQRFSPEIVVIDLENTRKDHTIDLGQNVTKIVYIPSTDETIHSLPFDIDEVAIDSDKHNTRLETPDFVNSFYGSVEPDPNYYRDALCLLQSNVPLHDVTINLNHDNALPDRKLIVCYSVVTASILRKLAEKQEKHNMANQRKALSNPEVEASFQQKNR
ncbi:hypothetical protein GWK08_08895 [Leptobacterium flavescens]|uniref:Uncharacterized protein n=1 Tax=Leptobacterium flavescens TaxID=472055 RepID=A0A6P0UJJ8_9FLAO|nr:hypothetical protein [Leptobacterium flavescens]NER13551.1 hypothetical protein [Leptobacterium flavescens]